MTRQAGTERAFTGQYWNHKDEGVSCSRHSASVFLTLSVIAFKPLKGGGRSDGPARVDRQRMHPHG
ncbi:MAG: hypothetical protein AAFX99_31275 [Myxococcota bacterium]